jgi:hypothetical protein
LDLWFNAQVFNDTSPFIEFNFNRIYIQANPNVPLEKAKRKLTTNIVISGFCIPAIVKPGNIIFTIVSLF